MIEIKGLTKSFGNKIVLNDLNLTIPSHTIFGLVGINGAGKSTLLRILSNAYDKTSGEVLIDGKSHTIFGELSLNQDDKLHLENDKFGLISLLNKSDIKLIRKIIEEGPDTKIFG